MNFHRILRISIVFLLVFAWLLAGWPQIWRDPPIPPGVEKVLAGDSIGFDAASSAIQTTTATSISWSHTTGIGDKRLLLVAVSVHLASGTPTTVTGITYGGVPLTQVTTALYSATTPQVRTYVFRLVNPASGANTVTVDFAAPTLSIAGAVTYTGVDQTTPIQASNTATGSGTTASVSVTVTGSGRWIFGHLGGHRTAAPREWTIMEGSGQTRRWEQTGGAAGTGWYKDVGSDKSNVLANSQSMSWTFDRAPNYVATAVVINPPRILNQSAFCWRNDDGDEEIATWKAAENTAITEVSTSEIIRIRIEVEETNSVAKTVQAQLEYSTDATDCTDGTWTPLDTETTEWRITQSDHINNGDPTTNQLTTSGRSFVAGRIFDTQNQDTMGVTLNNQHTEWEWAIRGDGAALGTTYYFRVTDAGTPLNAYAQCAQLTTEFPEFFTTIHIVGKDGDALVSKITFPTGAPGGIVSDPYNNLPGADGTPQVLHATDSEPVVRLKNTSEGALRVWLEITDWVFQGTSDPGVVSSQRYELRDPGVTNVEAVTEVLSPGGLANTVSTGEEIGAGAYKALYLEVTLSALAGKTGTSTLTILGESI